MNPDIVNTFGLLLDVVGVVIVFKFGWPQPDLGINTKITLNPAGFDPAPHIAKRLRYKRFSILGLTALIAGFTLQIVATWMN